MIELVWDNFVMVFELVGILVLLFVSVHLPKRTRIQTVIVVALLFLELTVYSLEKWSQTFATLSMLRPVTTATLYSLYPIVLVFLTQLTVSKKLLNKWIWISLIPVFICVPIFYTSQWSHWVFFFLEDNVYKSGPLGKLPYILFGLYVVMFLVQNAIYFKNYSKLERLAIAYIVLVPIAGVLVFLFTEANRDYAPIFTSAVLLYYIYLYIHLAKIDPLTTLLNRQSFYHDLASAGISGVASIDMNGLKTLNDTQGHEAGDAALKAVSEAMRDHCGSGRVYRVGGDEFAILFFGTKESEVQEIIQNMREGIAKTPYVCAFGYAMVDEKTSVLEAIRVSDERMYANKAELKRLEASQKPQ